MATRTRHDWKLDEQGEYPDKSGGSSAKTASGCSTSFGLAPTSKKRLGVSRSFGNSGNGWKL